MSAPIVKQSQERPVTPVSICTMLFILALMLTPSICLAAGSASAYDVLAASMDSPATSNDSNTEKPHSALDALEGKRLFFSAKERNALAQNTKPASAQSLPSSDSPTVFEELKTRSPVSAHNAVIAAQGLFPIRYKARLKGSRTIRIIVNGNPCIPLEREKLAASLSGLHVQCNSMVNSSIELIMQNDEQTLVLSRKGIIMGKLLPGQSF